MSAGEADQHGNRVLITIENDEWIRPPFAMSFAELLDELPALTVQQRQLVIRRALELEEPPLNDAEEALIESRLADHHKNPASSVPLDEMIHRLRSRS